MKNLSNQEQLLQDVLSESETNGFREALLGETLRLARHRRRTRQLWRVSPLLMLCVLAWFLIPMRRAVEKPTRRSVEIIATQPLGSAAVVCTQPLAAEHLVSSAPCVYVVHTRPGGEGVHLIGDEELMALVAPRPAVLVRLGPGSQTLIFADGKDVNGLHPN